jgi:hypothetical protein
VLERKEIRIYQLKKSKAAQIQTSAFNINSIYFRVDSKSQSTAVPLRYTAFAFFILGERSLFRFLVVYFSFKVFSLFLKVYAFSLYKKRSKAKNRPG